MKMLNRLAALSGLAASVLMVAGGVVADTWRTGLDPDPTDPSSLIAQALVMHRGSIRLGAQLLLPASFLFLWFASYLHGRLRRDAVNVWAPALVLGGGVVLSALLLVESGFAYAASELSDYSGDTQVAKVFLVWGWNSANLSAPALAAILLGSGIAGLSEGTLPRWLAWFAVGMFAISSLLAFGLATPGLATAVAIVWIAVASLILTFSTEAVSQPSII